MAAAAANNMAILHLIAEELIDLGLVVPNPYDPHDPTPRDRVINLLRHVAFNSRMLLALQSWRDATGNARPDEEKLPFKIAYEMFLKMYNRLLHIALGGADANAVAPHDVVPKTGNIAKPPLYDGEKSVRLGYWKPLVENHIEMCAPSATVPSKAHIIRAYLSSEVLGHMENRHK